jgi:putative IMPACT (imprinted ancient) family translation regulator
LDSTDSYKTIDRPTEEILFKEKNSKFYGYAFPINSEEEVKTLIEPLRKKHFNAVHFSVKVMRVIKEKNRVFKSTLLENQNKMFEIEIKNKD